METDGGLRFNAGIAVGLRENHSGMETRCVRVYNVAHKDSLRENHSGMETRYAGTVLSIP